MKLSPYECIWTKFEPVSNALWDQQENVRTDWAVLWVQSVHNSTACHYSARCRKRSEYVYWNIFRNKNHLLLCFDLSDGIFWAYCRNDIWNNHFVTFFWRPRFLGRLLRIFPGESVHGGRLSRPKNWDSNSRFLSGYPVFLRSGKG